MSLSLHQKLIANRGYSPKPLHCSLKFSRHRYILETYDDKYFSITGADLGYIIAFTPLKWLSLCAAIKSK